MGAMSKSLGSLGVVRVAEGYSLVMVSRRDPQEISSSVVQG